MTSVFVAIYFCNKAIENAAKGKLYSQTQFIKFNKVGLLLGTSKYVAGDNPNPYYNYRIEAAIKLLKAGKIKYIIISGDNSRKDYNEPKQMQSDLINAGIDSSIIYLDYAGFRTFDSVVRLKEIFGQDSVTVISQAFHNERAIYIASREGISAIGFNATNVDKNLGFRIQVREKLARVKVFLDFLFDKRPKYLGQKVSIP
jgi:SanA protein